MTSVYRKNRRFGVGRMLSDKKNEQIWQKSTLIHLLLFNLEINSVNPTVSKRIL